MYFARINLVVFAVLLLLAGATHAANPEPLLYDRISLSISAEREVKADLLVAVLATQQEGPDAAKLAGEVNALMAWALDEAKSEEKVVTETLAYITNPVYSTGKLTGWRVRQSIRLQSQDGDALSRLIGRLQTRLLLESVGYELSEASRKQAEDALIRSGIEAFKARAQLIAEQMGQPRHRLVEMHVDTQGERPAPVYRGLAAAPMADADTAPIPPRIEAGKQTAKVHISGIIELQVQ